MTQLSHQKCFAESSVQKVFQQFLTISRILAGIFPAANFSSKFGWYLAKPNFVWRIFGGLRVYLTFLGHMTSSDSSLTWPINSSHAISYCCPFGTESLSSTVFEICIQIYLGHDVDLSRSRDVIGHETIWHSRCHFL